MRRYVVYRLSAAAGASCVAGLGVDAVLRWV